METKKGKHFSKFVIFSMIVIAIGFASILHLVVKKPHVTENNHNYITTASSIPISAVKPKQPVVIPKSKTMSVLTGQKVLSISYSDEYSDETLYFSGFDGRSFADRGTFLFTDVKKTTFKVQVLMLSLSRCNFILKTAMKFLLIGEVIPLK